MRKRGRQKGRQAEEGPKLRNAGDFQKVEKTREQIIFPPRASRNNAALTYLNFSLQDPLRLLISGAVRQ